MITIPNDNLTVATVTDRTMWGAKDEMVAATSQHLWGSLGKNAGITLALVSRNGRRDLHCGFALMDQRYS